VDAGSIIDVSAVHVTSFFNIGVNMHVDIRFVAAVPQG
jgi:hypothetical protein